MSVCLMLHGLGSVPAHVPEQEKPYWISEATFAEVVSLARDAEVQLTIDDGNSTDVEIAMPALLTAGIKAMFFIPSDRIGTPHYVSEHDIQTLHDAGMEIGSHGCAHVRWTEVPDEAIAADVRRSTERLAEIIGEPVRTVAVPYGACDRRVFGVLHALGITRVYTSFSGRYMPNGWIVRRNCIKSGMTPTDIRTLVTKKDTLACKALAFLRTWRHAGRAALWTG
jgi:peptidoglycan/xylan/chitin deacetylase (PgdA/CDA1 family)